MGEMAELILMGEVCEGCGEEFMDDEAPGHPRRCTRCQSPTKVTRRKK